MKKPVPIDLDAVLDNPPVEVLRTLLHYGFLVGSETSEQASAVWFVIADDPKVKELVGDERGSDGLLAKDWSDAIKVMLPQELQECRARVREAAEKYLVRQRAFHNGWSVT